ncbi:DUF308 domain-containing protein [Nostoc sp.]|uniref:DUF308 domain-containing protein n=1 Tax=Nostoc sp. TaxID=1180 RepID=UPI002FFC3A3C
MIALAQPAAGIAFPFFASVTSALVFGWIFVFAGIAQIIYAFESICAGFVAWKLVLGILSNADAAFWTVFTRYLNKSGVANLFGSSDKQSTHRHQIVDTQ